MDTPSKIPVPAAIGTMGTMKHTNPLSEQQPQPMDLSSSMNSGPKVSFLPPLSSPNSATHSRSNTGSGFDRVNTPGKLRAFFDEVKKSKSINGGQVSIPQKYKEMLAEERSSGRSDPSRNALPDNTTFTLVNQRPSLVAGTGIVPRLKRTGSDASQRRKTISGPEDLTDGQLTPQSPSSRNQLPAKASTIPRRHSSLYKPPTDNDESVGEMEASSRPIFAGGGPEPNPPAIGGFSQQVRSVDPTVKKAVLNNLNRPAPQSEPQPPPPPKDDPMEIDQPLMTQPKQLQPQTQPQAQPQPKKTVNKVQVKEKKEEEKPKPRAPTPAGMKRCEYCERCFVEDRLDRHKSVCQSSPSKQGRKVFDSRKARILGTDFAKSANAASMVDEAIEYFEPGKKKAEAASKPKVHPKNPKTANWREQHEAFIKSVRSARQ